MAATKPSKTKRSFRRASYGSVNLNKSLVHSQHMVYYKCLKTSSLIFKSSSNYFPNILEKGLWQADSKKLMDRDVTQTIHAKRALEKVRP